ncbi:HAD family hydrolase [Nonomuraea sp. NPDC050790]|uniref:HAD family hydrolase n=1 Tax=Nonomuraea sp. NPDC050790 TaxID=3364371 RepID=UPI00378D3DA3
MLSFNGTTCDLYAEMNAEALAGDIRSRLYAEGVRMSLLTLVVTDPLWWVAIAHTVDGDSGAKAEEAVRAAEMAAALKAVPTPGTSEVLTACRATGRRVAVVGDTCVPAMESYLDLHGLRHLVGPVIGRDHRHPTTETPGFDLLWIAASALNAEPSDCTLISVSSDELVVASDAGLQGLGVVSKYDKRKHLAASTADSAVVSSMRQLAEALMSVPITTPPPAQIAGL